MLDKSFHSINIVGTLYLISRNVDFRNFILQLSYYKNNFQPQKFSLDNCQYTNLLVQITLRMVFTKRKSETCFLIPYLFHIFQGPSFLGSGSRVWVQVLEVAIYFMFCVTEHLRHMACSVIEINICSQDLQDIIIYKTIKRIYCNQQRVF